MARIRVLKNTFINGKPVLAGKERDVNERTAGLLIGRNMAEKVVADKNKKAEEVEHDDN